VCCKAHQIRYVVAFSPDGKEIALVLLTASAGVDAKTAMTEEAARSHWFGLLVAFSPDGNQIVSGSFDNSIWVWDAKTATS